MGEAVVERIAIIGFGEVGGIFGKDLADKDRDVAIFDILIHDDRLRQDILKKAELADVRPTKTSAEAVAGADLVISAVTASSAINAAIDATTSLHSGQIYMDLNSVSPETKKQIGTQVERTGADFVEAAVMAAVKSPRLKVPILLGGTRAFDLACRLQTFGMSTKAVSKEIGVASAIKMCRSVVMKGLAALAIESLFAARRYGAEDAVIASLEETYPGMGWAKGLPDALARRAVEHSRRRAAEMREVVATLKAAGMKFGMASATAELQDWLTSEMERRDYAFKGDESFQWQAFADMISQD